MTFEIPPKARVAMAEQLSLDALARDPVAARHEAERGMEQASRADRVQAWKRRADGWLEQQGGREITADTLVSEIGLPDGLGERERPNNVVGAWFSAKSKHGLIEWTGRHARSERVIGHGNLQRVWKVHERGRLSPPSARLSRQPG